MMVLPVPRATQAFPLPFLEHPIGALLGLASMQHSDSGPCVPRKRTFHPVEIIHCCTFEQLHIHGPVAPHHAPVIGVGQALIEHHKVNRLAIGFNQLENFLIWNSQRNISKCYLCYVAELSSGLLVVMVHVFLSTKVGRDVNFRLEHYFSSVIPACGIVES